MRRLITVLAGGTGSVKLVRGLAKVSDKITVISNVGDNIWLSGLYVCPDIDTITYGLAGILDEKKGWGIKGDTFFFLEQARKMGMESWFRLGDRDLATHIMRTEMYKNGATLSKITGIFAKRLGVTHKVIPATDDEVTTSIMTLKGEMHLQEFWVKNSGRPRVTAIRYDGAKKAKASLQALNAIRSSEMVVIAPANPASSIGPMLALADLRKELARARSRVVAVSPLIGKKAVSGPAVKYMKAIGFQNSPVGVAEFYRDIAGSFVISERDHQFASSIQKLRMDVYQTNITMRGKQDEVRLGKYLCRKLLN